MSWLPCNSCGDFADTDSGDGSWDVKTTTGKTKEFVCGVCCERYLDEEGVFNPDLPEAA